MNRKAIRLAGILGILCIWPVSALEVEAPASSVGAQASMDIRIRIELSPVLASLGGFLGLDERPLEQAIGQREDESERGLPPSTAGAVSQPESGDSIRDCLTAARVLARVALRQVHRLIFAPFVN